MKYVFMLYSNFHNLYKSYKISIHEFINMTTLNNEFLSLLSITRLRYLNYTAAKVQYYANHRRIEIIKPHCLFE